ncbi:MAG: CBS domain-containing protein [Planctomycetota bacterium]|jgi:CBS domain-containing protein
MLKALTDLKARDLMKKRVITLPATAPVSEAISIFEDEHITGIPVVDDGGSVIGMLTEHDVARTEHMQRGRIESEGGNYDFAGNNDDVDGSSDEESEFYGKEDYSPAVLGHTLVKDWMHSGVVSVGPDAGLKEICETMTREAVHRVLVVDKRKLLGIVSTVDVVQHLARVL